MGWCSGTEVFDAIAEALLSDKPLDKKEVLKTVILALWDRDWDCETDSRFFKHPLVRESLIELDPDWEEYFDDT